MLFESFAAFSVSFAGGVLVGGVVGWVFGTYSARPREETTTSYEQRGWIFKRIVNVEKRKIIWKGMTLSKITEERTVAQAVDMKTVRGLRHETERLANGVLRFLPVTRGIRKLLGG